MPNSAQEQATRRDTLRQLLRRGSAGTQQSLVDALQSLGLVATQSSVSRDLKELGAIKTARGYELPATGKVRDDEFASVAEFLREVTPAGPNLLVIKTAIGAAQRVALALDRSNWPEMIGNVGGDDTVFVASATSTTQKILMSRIERARG